MNIKEKIKLYEENIKKNKIIGYKKSQIISNNVRRKINEWNSINNNLEEEEKGKKEEEKKEKKEEEKKEKKEEGKKEKKIKNKNNENEEEYELENGIINM